MRSSVTRSEPTGLRITPCRMWRYHNDRLEFVKSFSLIEWSRIPWTFHYSYANRILYQKQLARDRSHFGEMEDAVDFAHGRVGIHIVSGDDCLHPFRYGLVFLLCRCRKV